MLELHILNPDITTGNLKVSWCVDKETLDKLAAAGNYNPAIVFAVAPEIPADLKIVKAALPETPASSATVADAASSEPPPVLTPEQAEELRIKQVAQTKQDALLLNKVRELESKEWRKVVPLKDLETYLELHTAGSNKIYAFIDSIRSASHAHSTWTRRGWDYYAPSIIDHSAGNVHTHVSSKHMTAEPLSIEVPANSFAPEPSAWEKAWVNWLFKSKPSNQCEFRRRRIFAYTLKPLLLLALLIPRILAFLGGLLYGSRGLSLNPILHPLSYDFDGMMSSLFGSDDEADRFVGTIFVGRGKSVFWNWIRLPFMPAIWVPCVLLWHYTNHGKLLAVTLIMTAVILVLGLITGMIHFLIAGAFGQLWDYLFGPKSPWWLKPGKEQLVLCGGDPNKPKPRSIKLYYQDLKAKICKPYSR